jgi:hypothetical protein
MGTKNNPGKFDCHAKAEPDEPMFTLLGRDPCAPILIEIWAAMRRTLSTDGKDAEKIEEALSCAHACREWSERVGERPVVVSEKGKISVGDSAHYVDRSVSTEIVGMMLGLVRAAEGKEQDSPKGELWDDRERKALAKARELGWGKGKVGRLP